jgi:hypothetical protein
MAVSAAAKVVIAQSIIQTVIFTNVAWIRKVLNLVEIVMTSLVQN